MSMNLESHGQSNAVEAVSETPRFPEGTVGVVNMMRHQEKGPTKKDDYKVGLTGDGLKAALGTRLGEELRALGFDTLVTDSGHGRTGQTASGVGAHFSGHEEYIPEKIPERAKQRSKQDVAGGPFSVIAERLRSEEKHGGDNRLAAAYGKEEWNEFDAKMFTAFEDGKLIPWLINESDRLAEELGVPNHPYTYSHVAGGLAQIILEQRRRVEEKRGENPEYKAALIAGTQQSMTEAFLAKVLEEAEGVDARDKFLEAIGDAGFGFGEGAEIQVIERDGEISYRVVYEKKDESGDVVYSIDETVPESVMQEIADLAVSDAQEA